MKSILEEYAGITLFVATIAAIVYIFRKQIVSAFTTGALSDITGKTVEQLKADLETVKDVSIMDLAKDIYISWTKSPISPDMNAEGLLAAINTASVSNTSDYNFYVDSSGIVRPLNKGLTDEQIKAFTARGILDFVRWATAAEIASYKTA